MDTAELLLEARRRAGLTQAELARRAGTSQAMVARYETGIASPTVRTLRRLLRAADRELKLSSVASEAQLSIELEVTAGSLVGQIIPPRAGTLGVHTTAGVASSPVDEIGCFAVTPIPNSPFRLRCRTETGPTC